MVPTFEEIESAHRRISAYINKTPVLSSNSINNILSTSLFFKCENFQKVGAFKFRGAINSVLLLDEKHLKRGVATHSSGNHAQALALAAKMMKTKAYIVMPETSPKVKVNAVKEYGGEITFCKPNLEARESTLTKIIEETNAIEIHPYNKYEIIQGQATAAKELLEEVPDLDIIIAPIGGGGLMSGTALSTSYISPTTKIVAAEPQNADDAYRSFYEGKFIPSENPDTIADGLLTSLGSITYPIIKNYVHQIVTVSEDAIVDAMKLVWERMKIIIEPSSAVPLASLLENKLYYKNKKIGIIISGGNIDLDKLPWMK